MIWLVVASLILVLLAFCLRVRVRTRQAALGFSGEVLYGAEQHGAELFVSELYGIVGKPDYIAKNGTTYVPVERKSRPVSEAGPYEGEILQLAVYGLLVEERFGRPVRHGRLQYPNRSIDVPFDAALREKLRRSLDRLREAELMDDVPRSHHSAARCRGCGFRGVCRDSLA